MGQHRAQQQVGLQVATEEDGLVGLGKVVEEFVGRRRQRAGLADLPLDTHTAGQLLEVVQDHSGASRQAISLLLLLAV